MHHGLIIYKFCAIIQIKFKQFVSFLLVWIPQQLLYRKRVGKRIHALKIILTQKLQVHSIFGYQFFSGLLAIGRLNLPNVVYCS